MVLVWEDENDIQELITYNLQQVGIEVIATDDEDRLWLEVKSMSPKIIIIGATAKKKDQRRIYKKLIEGPEALASRIICLVSNDKECCLSVPSRRLLLDSCIQIPIRPARLVREIQAIYAN